MRVADLGISIGLLPSGPTNSVLDIDGVGFGHTTIWRDDPPPPDGEGIARTGVTVLDFGGNPWRRPIPAGGAVLNGCGECTGFVAIRELGIIESPIFLTSTMQVGRVFDAAVQIMISEEPAIGIEDVTVPVVAECDDSFLSDPRTIRLTVDDVRAAVTEARACAGGTRFAEGAVGGGTGMSALGYKGGIGTASRILPDGHVVAILTMTNFGDRRRLTVGGLPVGRMLPDPDEQEAPERPAGSCIVVVVTDGLIDSAGCERLARRAGLGLARLGSTASHGSGEIFLACATGLRAERNESPTGVPVVGTALDPYFAAVVEATEEAALNSMLAAPTVVGRDGNTSHALPGAEVRRLLEQAGLTAGEGRG
ncbi:MAG TPA: P1 family peptidase [Mycobacteriales bacterium]|nr:P1 family peptidase [Mycobacteriales bacterium]